eukprot:scaffold8.g1532.t1
MTKFVVAVDDSPVSKNTLLWAARSLVRKGDNLTIVTVLEPALRSDFGNVGETSFPTDDLGETCKPDPVALQQRQKFLKECKEAVGKEGLDNVNLTTLVACTGGSHDMARHISEYAESSRADVLVMGSRGLGSWRRAALGLFGLGSVSDWIVKNARINVVVHKLPPKSK